MAEVWQNWEELKSQGAVGAKAASKLDGIPKGLGALQRGQKMQEKAARVGFDWPEIPGCATNWPRNFEELEDARRAKATRRTSARNWATSSSAS